MELEGQGAWLHHILISKKSLSFIQEGVGALYVAMPSVYLAPKNWWFECSNEVYNISIAQVAPDLCSKNHQKSRVKSGSVPKLDLRSVY